MCLAKVWYKTNANTVNKSIRYQAYLNYQSYLNYQYNLQYWRWASLMKSAHDDDDQTSDGQWCFVIMNQTSCNRISDGYCRSESNAWIFRHNRRCEGCSQSILRGYYAGSPYIFVTCRVWHKTSHDCCCLSLLSEELKTVKEKTRVLLTVVSWHKELRNWWQKDWLKVK